MFALWGLMSLTMLQGCAAPKPDIQPIPEIRNVYPIIPSNLLVCKSEPVPADILTDVDLAKFTEEVRVAGQECRNHLKAVKTQSDSWPR